MPRIGTFVICLRTIFPPTLAAPMDFAETLAQRATALDVASLLNISERQTSAIASNISVIFGVIFEAETP